MNICTIELLDHEPNKLGMYGSRWNRIFCTVWLKTRRLVYNVAFSTDAAFFRSFKQCLQRNLRATHVWRQNKNTWVDASWPKRAAFSFIRELILVCLQTECHIMGTFDVTWSLTTVQIDERSCFDRYCCLGWKKNCSLLAAASARIHSLFAITWYWWHALPSVRRKWEWQPAIWGHAY